MPWMKDASSPHGRGEFGENNGMSPLWSSIPALGSVTAPFSPGREWLGMRAPHSKNWSRRQKFSPEHQEQILQLLCRNGPLPPLGSIMPGGSRSAPPPSFFDNPFPPSRCRQALARAADAQTCLATLMPAVPLQPNVSRDAQRSAQRRP